MVASLDVGASRRDQGHRRDQVVDELRHLVVAEEHPAAVRTAVAPTDCDFVAVDAQCPLARGARDRERRDAELERAGHREVRALGGQCRELLVEEVGHVELADRVGVTRAQVQGRHVRLLGSRTVCPGPPEGAYPIVALDDPSLRLGLPTCWDEWFPEVARLYSLGGAQVLCYPTAIGSEPDHPDFDTQPLWQQVIVGNGIANGLFMVVPNRFGTEGLITFYGSSFISDPYGRILVQAPRDEAAVLFADLDLAQRDDWLTLFPFLATRRPDSYAALAEPVRDEHRRVVAD